VSFLTATTAERRRRAFDAFPERFDFARFLGIDGLLIDSFHLRAARAAEDPISQLHSVPDHPAAAVLADGGEAVDGALERVEGPPLASQTDLHGATVVVSTDVAASHGGA
jgi:hypothetical protein